MLKFAPDVSSTQNRICLKFFPPMQRDRNGLTTALRTTALVCSNHQSVVSGLQSFTAAAIDQNLEIVVAGIKTSWNLFWADTAVSEHF